MRFARYFGSAQDKPKNAVAEARAAVTDTHPLLFHAASGGRLSRRAAAFFNRCEKCEAIIYVPAAVIWECGLLFRVNRIDLRRSLRAFFDDLFSNPAYQPIDVSPDQVYVADEIRFNRDPFDALIVAAARTVGLPLITRDEEIRQSGVIKVIW